MTEATDAVVRHFVEFFEGHNVSRLRELPGLQRTLERAPEFEVITIGPGPRSPLWCFATVGCWDAHQIDGHGLEFLLVAPDGDPRHWLTIAMTAYFHAGPTGQQLDVGHTVPIGEPWIEGSRCDHLLVSVPYPFGPELELCEWASGHARILWLVPITSTERAFKTANGLEALESRFDEAGLEYWNPGRPSVT